MRPSWRSLFLLALVLATSLGPVIWGRQTLFQRDVFNTHLGYRFAAAESLCDGRLPLIDPQRAGGQPLAGNPNSLLMYPSTALLLLGCDQLATVEGRRLFFWGFNAHFWLHWLAMPLAMAALARAAGLSRLGALFAGGVYAASGYAQSQLAFANLIAGVALTPAFCAAVIATGKRAGEGRAHAQLAAVAGLLWGLLLLAGDPLQAVQAAAIALVGWWLLVPNRPSPTRPAGYGRRVLALALFAGTLLAAPLWVELGRIVGWSYRGHAGYSATTATVASLDPRQALDWLLPMPFGEPTELDPKAFWGTRFHTNWRPFFASLYPGLLAFVLIAAAGFPRRPLARFAWLLVACGLFLALGRFNPLARPLFELFAAATRYPIKLFLPVAIGVALLAGLGAERWLVGGETRAARRGYGTLAGLAALFALALAIGQLFPQAGRQAFAWLVATASGATASPALVSSELARWTALATASLALLLVATLLLLAAQRGRRLVPAEGGPWLLLLLGLHLVSQLLFLAPLRATDAVLPYVVPPPLATALPAGARVAHGDHQNLFGRAELTAGRFPESTLRWLARRAAFELRPFAGRILGMRYELETSAEGLDAFLSRIAGPLVRQVADDGQRLRLLRTWGVTHLLTSRPLELPGPDGPVSESVELVRVQPGPGAPVHVYRFLAPLLEVSLAQTVLRAPHVNAAAAMLLSPSFDPTQQVVLAGDEARSDSGAPAAADYAAAGQIEVLTHGPEELVVAVVANGPATLVVRRVHLPLWRATIDGVEVPVAVANMYQMAIEVAPAPAGRRVVRLWVDRAPLGKSLLLSVFALMALAGLAWRGRRGSNR